MPSKENMSPNILGLKRWLMIVLMVVALAWIQYLIWFDDYGLAYQKKQEVTLNDVADQEKQVQGHYQKIRNEVASWLNNPEAVEEESRESLGMIAKDEVLYVINDD